MVQSMCKIDARLRGVFEIKPAPFDDNEPFGGMSVLFAGDFWQLPRGRRRISSLRTGTATSRLRNKLTVDRLRHSTITR